MREKINLAKRSIKEINKCRKENGLPEIQVKPRKCLRCGKNFKSKGMFTCPRCRSHLKEVYEC